MIDFLIQHYPLILGILSLNILFSMLMCAMALRRQNKKYLLELKKLQANINVITSGSLGMGQRMIALEQKFNHLHSTQEEMKQSDLDYAFSQAQKLIEQGVDGQTVAANSGLSSSEIQLMQLLHNTKQRTADVTYG